METVFFPDDLRSSSLCDKRLRERLSLIIDDLSEDPSLSFPDAMTPGDLLGYYRFTGNERLCFGSVLWGHVEETTRRCSGVEDLLVLHDTSDFECSSVSFRGHFSLALTLDRRPLGFLSVLPMERGAQQRKVAGSPSEQDRWAWGVHFSNQRVPKAVHVMDREGDDYKLLEWLTESQMHFVIRGRIDRRLENGEKISNALAEAQLVAVRTVHLGGRLAKGNKEDQKAHPARDERVAKLAIRATQVQIRNPADSRKSLSLNVVHVTEIDPPEGVEPVEWRLITNEAIHTPEMILRVVDIYRVRWVIEEFFKALKTGCQFEKRQHESYDAMLIALAIFVPIATQMLQLRALSRIDENLPAQAVLTEVQLNILSSHRRTARFPLVTVRDSLRAVAALGGHLKNNGEPGWLTLGRGMEKLHSYEVGWSLRDSFEM